MVKKKIKTIFVMIVFLIIVFSVKVFASDIEYELKTTEEYDKWNDLSNEEKENTLMPSVSSPDIPESIINQYKKKNTSVMSNYIETARNFWVKGLGLDLNYVGASVSDSRFNLADYMQIRVENQGSTAECWAFSTIKALETNMALKYGENSLRDFSERHMDYATSQSFKNNEFNKYGLNRKVSDGGLPITGLAYLINGQGAVLEEKMPFKDNKDLEDLSYVQSIPVDTIVTDYRVLPAIKKQYEHDSKGNTTSVKYYNAKNKEYSSEELQAVRNIIKEHLINYGAIATMNCGSGAKYYNNPSNPFKSTAYNCNDSSKVRDHAVTIVGWDDNYSKDNFAEGTKPSTDGAYIVLNSYGSSNFDNGYMYISYEDKFIEEEIYGIASEEKCDYDYLYQYDNFGGIFEIGTSTADKGYIGNVFQRKTTSDEVLTSVGITIPEYSKANVYINAKSSSMDEKDLIKVATGTEVLAPGYHRIDIEPTRIEGAEFAIVIEQLGENGTFYFSVEAPQVGTAYGNVNSENKGFVSTDCKKWTNIADLKVSIDAKKADLCIKAFSEIKPEDTPIDPVDPGSQEIISSDVYMIDDAYIMKVNYDTTIGQFKANINSSLEYQIEENGNNITDNNELIKTGMILSLQNGKKYSIIVNGDIKEDGKLTLTDLSKLILHYNEVRGFELTGNRLKAADINADGVVNLVDISRMIVLYNEI